MDLEGEGSGQKVKLSKRKIGGFLIALIAIIGLSMLMGMNFRQLLSVSIVSSFILGTVFFWQFRLSFAFLGMALLLATGTIDIQRFVESSSIDVILFLMGMMVFIGYLEKYHIFDYLITKLIANFTKSGRALFITFMVISAVSAALIDEVTSILFMVGIAISVTQKMKIDPVPLIMASIFATNIGSSATVIGNPVGVMLALRTDLTFNDFLMNATPVAALALIALIAFLLFEKSKYIKKMDEKVRELRRGEIANYKVPEKFSIRIAFFLIILLGLVFHVYLENMLGLGKNVLLLGVALFAAGLVIFFERNGAREFFESRVDFWTLSFFLILFASADNLKNLGVTDILAKNMAGLLGNDPYIFLGGFMLITGVLSAALDNVVAVATFIPVAQSLQTVAPVALQGNLLNWTLLFAATFFGNLTIIGSTANIVAASLMEKRGIRIPSFAEWFRLGAKVVFVTVLVALLALFSRIYFGF